MTQKFYVDSILYNPSIIVFEWDKKNMEVSFYNKIKDREETKKIKADRDGDLYFYANGQTFYKRHLHVIEYKEINL